MQIQPHPSLIVLSFVLAASGARTAVAQPPGRQPKTTPIRAESELKKVVPGFMQVTTKAAETWVLKIEAPPENISLHGTAEPNWLRPGMLVRFSALMNKRGEAQEPVRELFVFTARPEYQIGIFPENKFGLGAGAGPTRGRRAKDTVSNYLVAGRLKSLKNGKLTIVAGRATAKVTLAEDAVIKVDLLGDYRLARPGDTVEFSGQFLEKGRAIVKKLGITAAQPFRGTDTKGGTARRQRRRRARPDPPETPELAKPPATLPEDESR
jgi:hypothetical protein